MPTQTCRWVQGFGPQINPCPGPEGDLPGRAYWVIKMSNFHVINGVGQIESCGDILMIRAFSQWEIKGFYGSSPLPIHFECWKDTPFDTKDTNWYVDRGFQPWPRDFLPNGLSNMHLDWVRVPGYTHSPFPDTSGLRDPGMSQWSRDFFDLPALWTRHDIATPGDWLKIINIDVSVPVRAALSMGDTHFCLRIRDSTTTLVGDKTQVNWAGYQAQMILTYGDGGPGPSPQVIVEAQIVTLECRLLEACAVNIGPHFRNTVMLQDFQRQGITRVRRGNTVLITAKLLDHSHIPPIPAKGLVLLTLRDQDGNIVLENQPMLRIIPGVYRWAYRTQNSDPLTLYTSELTFDSAQPEPEFA